MAENIKLGRTARGKKPQYFSDPAIDKLLSMVLTLAGELSVTRQRLDAVERLIEQHGLFEQAQIDGLEFSGQALEAREQQRAEYLARLMRTLQMDLEQTVGKDMSVGFDDLIKEMSC
jgi:hypothetical protein